MSKIKIYTDGACSPNPGKGGWAWAIDYETYDAGEEAEATNNTMELTAIIEAIRYGKEYYDEVIIVSDSKYCVDGFNSWMRSWAKKGWPDKIKNQTLWKQLFRNKRGVTLKWVRGHNGNEMNEFVDELASNETL